MKRLATAFLAGALIVAACGGEDAAVEPTKPADTREGQIDEATELIDPRTEYGRNDQHAHFLHPLRQAWALE